MAKRIYVGVNGAARRVRRVYVGINGTARKVKMAYLGVGGVARPCFSSEPSYWGQAPALSVDRERLAATTVGNFAIFGGGEDSQANSSANVDAYSQDLAYRQAANLGAARSHLSAATAGNYAIFAGGLISNVASSKVDAYASDLTKRTVSDLSEAKNSLAAATVGNYALFAGGATFGGSYNYLNSVDAYDRDLARRTPAVLSTRRTAMTAANAGEYALFAGGQGSVSGTIGNSVYYATIDAYSTTLAHSTPAPMSIARNSLAGASAGNYALFSGGNAIDIGYSTTTEAYNALLNRSTPAPLSYARQGHTGTRLGENAVFAYGFTLTLSPEIELYSESLVKTTLPPTTTTSIRGYLASTSIGNFALIGGGRGSSSVDVYSN